MRGKRSYPIPPVSSPTVGPSRNDITNTLPPGPLSLLPDGHQPNVGPNGWVTTYVLGASIRDDASQVDTSRALLLSDPSSTFTEAHQLNTHTHTHTRTHARARARNKPRCGSTAGLACGCWIGLAFDRMWRRCSPVRPGRTTSQVGLGWYNAFCNRES